jgi:hypothetical protein
MTFRIGQCNAINDSSIDESVGKNEGAAPGCIKLIWLNAVRLFAEAAQSAHIAPGFPTPKIGQCSEQLPQMCNETV